MAGRRMFLGFIAGMVSYSLIAKNKESLRPLAVKAVRGVLVFSEQAKEMVQDVVAEAQEKHEQHCRKLVQQNIKKQLEDLEQSSKDPLEYDIHDLQNKLNQLQKRMSSFHEKADNR